MRNPAGPLVPRLLRSLLWVALWELLPVAGQASEAAERPAPPQAPVQHFDSDPLACKPESIRASYKAHLLPYADQSPEVLAKLRRTGICGAMETLLIDADFPDSAALVAALIDEGCEVRGDARIKALDPRVIPASANDWDTEYLDAILSVAMVDGLDDALGHIARHSSGHTDVIVTGDNAVAERFLTQVDSAIVMHNASSQFADGGEFGLGAEIGIATGRLHARGPVALEGLTTYKWQVRGSGQTRP